MGGRRGFFFGLDEEEELGEARTVVNAIWMPCSKLSRVRRPVEKPEGSAPPRPAAPVAGTPVRQTRDHLTRTIETSLITQTQACRTRSSRMRLRKAIGVDSHRPRTTIESTWRPGDPPCNARIPTFTLAGVVPLGFQATLRSRPRPPDASADMDLAVPSATLSQKPCRGQSRPWTRTR